MRMSIRTSMIVALIAGVAIGCAGKSQDRGRRLDYCSCEMWGVTGMDPGPGHQPSPRPAACKRILKRPAERNCPIPP